MKNKKYEADKKILELLKKNSSRSLTRENFKEKLPIVRNIGEIEGVLYATFLNAIKRLEEKGDIKIKQEKDPITGKVIERYILVEKEKIANPETMEMIISGLKSKVQIIRACASFDLVTLCRTKKIMNPKHLKFLIEIAIDNKFDEKVRGNIIWALQMILVDLLEDDEDELINLITSNADEFRKIVLNESEELDIRDATMTILGIIDEEKAADVALTILEQPDDTYEKLDMTEVVIPAHKTNIRKRIYELLKHENKLVRDRAMKRFLETRHLIA